MKSPEQRLRDLGIVLPEATRPVASYASFTRSDRTLYLSGQGPIRDGKVIYSGVVGADLTEEQGYEAARLTILNSLAVMRSALGSLDKVSKILKLMAWVRSAPGYQRQHVVVNGASDLLIELFGDAGYHARSAVSAPELPFGIAVEIDLVVETSAE